MVANDAADLLEKGSDLLSKRNVSLAAARELYGENRSHASPESTLLSDHAIRPGSARGDGCLELYDPDASVVKPIDQPTGKLERRFDLGSVAHDDPCFVDRHGLAPQFLSD